MKNKFSYSIVFLLLNVAIGLSGCETSFLDAKPNKALVVPSTLQDFQALLDNAYNVMNITPHLGEVASDNYIMRNNSVQSYSETLQNAYRWEKRVYSGLTASDWDICYKQVFYANVVLDGLVRHEDNSQYRNIKGMALFYRAWALHQAAQLFAAPYTPGSTNPELGIPVRTSSDITIKSGRGTLQQTYDQILSDTEEAISLLHTEQEVPTRPSKAAAFALMARLQLNMQNYEKAGLYADSTLALNSRILDYNTLDSTRTFPMPSLYLTSNRHPEILFLTILLPNSFLGSNLNTLVNQELYSLYDNNDLRKTLFFDNSGQFSGTYIGVRGFQFSGLATDEMYLIRAEANARAGKVEEACADLNTLLVSRWKKNQFQPIGLTNKEEVVKIILNERRKQLIARGTRWSDLRRLNQDMEFAKTLYRNIDGKEYRLLPQDKRYTFPIPDNELAASGLQQNER